MIERALIHVAGPPGSGKTTLLTHFLRKTDRMIAAVRCIRDDTLDAPEDSAPEDRPELQAYRVAGADPVALFRFPKPYNVTEAFYETSLMEDCSEVVLLEGDRPLPWSDLSVYVAPPPPDGGRLLLRRDTDPARERAGEIELLEKALSNRERMVELLSALSGLPLYLFVRNDSETLDKLEQDVAARLAELREAPLPEPRGYWALAEGYAGIEHAQVVVVNVRDGRHEEGDAMLEDLRRLRADKAVFEDILGWKGKRTPITAVAADLSDPRDPGLRKSITRIKRALPQRG